MEKDKTNEFMEAWETATMAAPPKPIDYGQIGRAKSGPSLQECKNPKCLEERIESDKARRGLVTLATCYEESLEELRKAAKALVDAIYETHYCYCDTHDFPKEVREQLEIIQELL
jgi:hypothetical protein